MTVSAPMYENLSDPRLESAVLGGATVNHEYARQAALVVTERHFTSDRARAHWNCIAWCLDTGRTVNGTTVWEAAGALKLRGVVTLGYLTSVDDDLPRQIYGYDSWLQSVDELRMRRALATSLYELDRRNCERAEPFGSVLESARKIVTKLESQTGGRSALLSPADVVQNAGGLDVFFGPERLANVIPSPHWSVQRHFLGFQPETYVLLAGRPSFGKSALALQWGAHAARLGHSVVFYSLEMAKETLVQRLMALETRATLWDIIRGSLSAAERQQLQRALIQMSDLPFRLAYVPHVTVPMIHGHLAKLSERPGLVIIDYLQLINTTANGNRNESVSEVSRGLKLLAGEFQTCVVALSQLKRPERGDDRDGPQLHHLRDSGSLEQDADVVFFLHGSEADKSRPRRNVDLLIAKQRNGALGKAPLLFDAPHQRFEEVDGSQVCTNDGNDE